MSENSGVPPRPKRRVKRFLSPSQKYEIYLQLVRPEVRIAEAASTEQVDRSTIIRLRTVAKEGALAALAASTPDVGAKARDDELEQTAPWYTRHWVDWPPANDLSMRAWSGRSPAVASEAGRRREPTGDRR